VKIPDPVDSLPDAPILERADASLLYLGATRRGREIWLDHQQMTRHMLVIGSTGSGKSELLLGLSANAIASGNGVLFVDGKGDISTFARMHALAESFGRRDDILLLNFSHGVPVGHKADRVLSNTANPFLDLSADAIVQILVSLMEEAGGDNAMWKGRAIAMLTGVIRAATWLRDAGHMRMDVSDVRELCSLPRIIDLADEKCHPDLPQAIRKVIRAYLTALPGFNKDKGERQSQTTLDQHGYLEMQTTRFFSTLADVYGHIFSASTSHIDMKDVVLNRRIVMVMLPVLEKSSDEVASLGRIVVALLKNMMSSAMHVPVEGTWEDVVEKRPTNADYPFMVILDEVSHYMTDGMAAMAGQARSLGFCLVFATQDLGQMENSNRKETSAILANTNIKLFMRMTSGLDIQRQEMLPNNERWQNGRSDQEDILRDRLSYIQDRLMAERNQHLPRGRPNIMASLLREQTETYEAKIRLLEDNPNYRLDGTYKTLKPGEFIAVQGRDFLIGRSLYIGSAVERGDIALNHFVQYDADPVSIRAAHNRPLQISSFMHDPTAAFKNVAPLPSAWVWRETSRTPKAAIRRAFAVVGHQPWLWSHDGRDMDGAAAVPARRLLVLGE
jgi:hypothetical protein